MKKFLGKISAVFFALISLSAFAQSLSSVSLYNRALSKQQDEDYYGASEDFQLALQQNPSYGEAWFHLAEVTYSTGDYTLALSYLDSADKYAKNRTDIQNLRGLCYISLGQFSDAENVFNDVLKKSPNDINARFGLAELDLYEGSYIAAKNQYEDALKRDVNNRKALLSLALISQETDKNDAAEKYITQALKYYSGDAVVHYLAGYLEAKKGNLKEAERRVRSAIQIDSDLVKSYELLSSILYAQERYDDVIDICDYLLSKKRENFQAWYMKGLSQYRKNHVSDALETWSLGLAVNPQDEIMRSALELAAIKNLPVEDERRAGWAAYHLQKGREYSKIFMGEKARYEYQRALKINPYDLAARREFAELLSRNSLNENYLYQMKFIKQTQETKSSSDSSNSNKKLSADEIRVSDTIESYDALLKYSLSAKWNVDPFYLDKTRWHIGIYYQKPSMQLLHSDAEEIAASMAADIFSGVASTSVVVENQPVSGYGEAFRLARTNKMDYFVLLSVDETDREITLSAIVYSGRTGTETARFSAFRTGNDRFASVLRSFRRDILDMLPVRGKIIDKTVNDILVDLGTVEGMKKDAVLDVVKAGRIKTADKGPGVTFDKKDSLGKITLTEAGEEISQGTLEESGFYDRVNVGDEVLLRSLPAENDGTNEQLAENNPAAGENGERILPDNGNEQENKKLSAEELGLVRTPVIVDLIRAIRN